MPFTRDIDLSEAIFLARVCREAYGQFSTGGAYVIPDGYTEMLCVTGRACDRPELFGFVLRSARNAIVTFRGTVTDKDCIADAEIFQTGFAFAPGRLRTHDGFTAVYRSLRDKVMEALGAIPPEVPLYVAGHSLGGALATLLALDVAVNLPPRKPAVYTFASPRVGSPLFVTAFNREIDSSLRVVNVHDLVPRLPPVFIPLPRTGSPLHYSHVKREVAISAQAGTVRGNHSIETYIDGMNRLRTATTSGIPALRGDAEMSPRRRLRGSRSRGSLISRRRPG